MLDSDSELDFDGFVSSDFDENKQKFAFEKLEWLKFTLKMGHAQINVRTLACSRTFIVSSKLAALTQCEWEIVNAHRGCDEEHLVSDVVYPGHNRTEGNAREYVGIVALPWVVHLAVEGDWVKGTATSKHSPSL